MKRLKGFVHTAYDVSRSGFATLPDAATEQRLAVCRGCPERDAAAQTLRCGACGCDMAIKARFAATTCPTGQW